MQEWHAYFPIFSKGITAHFPLVEHKRIEEKNSDEHTSRNKGPPRNQDDIVCLFT